VPWPSDPIPMVSGVTLYRVRGTEIDAGEFIGLGRN
jgi:ribosomal protein L27